MSFQAMAWAVKQKVGNATGKAILLMLANYADENGECYPSQETLASECECSKRSVLDWLQKFEDMGILARERRHGTGGYRRADLLCLNLSAGNSRENISGENPSKPKCRRFTAEPITEPITSSLRSDVSERAKKRDGVPEALEAYSVVAARCGLPAVRVLSDARKRKLVSLLKTHGLPVWLEALAKVEASDFCLGRKGDFRADLDFLLQQQSFTRLLEGRYDNRTAPVGCESAKQSQKSEFDDPSIMWMRLGQGLEQRNAAEPDRNERPLLASSECAGNPAGNVADFPVADPKYAGRFERGR